MEDPERQALRSRGAQQGRVAPAQDPGQRADRVRGLRRVPEGDLKAELWGDGVSGATGQSYTNATSYLTILGGWKNTKQVLARLDEHGDNRLEIDIDKNSDDERAPGVAGATVPLQDQSAPTARRSAGR